MKIGVFSDTHDNVESIQRAMDIFNAENVDLLVHCGDWNLPATVEIIAISAESMRVPLFGVFGNNDKQIRKVLELNKSLHDPIEFPPKGVLEFTATKKRFAVYHGDDKKLLNDLINSKNYDVIFTGHTHKAKKDYRHATLVLNPGSTAFEIPRIKGGGQTSIAIYDTITTTSQIILLK